ncbi:MAG: rhodanese-like domain-containing protein [Candidatus Methylopumilus sp.]|jgi:rhodanese-related sulfurtransferase|nr:rhodanese-like domain-containing protein [Candidatus Methylopumilus sp.]
MKKYQDIEASDLNSLLETQKIYLIDVRNDDEVARGVIPGAIYITLSSIPSVNFLQLENQTVVFYCHAGVRSAQAAGFVADQIEATIYNLRGGILAWANAGFGLTDLK